MQPKQVDDLSLLDEKRRNNIERFDKSEHASRSQEPERIQKQVQESQRFNLQNNRDRPISTQPSGNREAEKQKDQKLAESSKAAILRSSARSNSEVTYGAVNKHESGQASFVTVKRNHDIPSGLKIQMSIRKTDEAGNTHQTVEYKPGFKPSRDQKLKLPQTKVSGDISKEISMKVRKYESEQDVPRPPQNSIKSQDLSLPTPPRPIRVRPPGQLQDLSLPNHPRPIRVKPPNQVQDASLSSPPKLMELRRQNTPKTKTEMKECFKDKITKKLKCLVKLKM